MTTTLPPVGSVWVHTKDPHDIIVIKGYKTIGSQNNRDHKNKVIKVHRVNTNTPTIEILHTFTSRFKPLEQGEQQ